MEWPGLAHFLEHMLFMGSKVNADEDAFFHFIEQNGGQSNAYTSLEETNFYFSIDKSALIPALDLFAGFFNSPLLSANSIEREMIAVNNEHEKNLQNDDWRTWQMLKNSSDPNFPFSHFSTGDLKTLNKTGVRDALVDFYKVCNHFVRLTVIGKSLNILT
jgi:insulysin